MAEKAFPIPNQSEQGGPYSAVELAEFVKMLSGGFFAHSGIYRGILDSFEPTVDGSSVDVAPGLGVFNGFVYADDEAATLTPDTPSSGTTGFRVVMRITWDSPSAGLIDIGPAISMSADGTAAVPDLVQTVGTTWEEPIGSFTITTGGTITILDDDRVFHPRTPVTRRRPMWQAMGYADIGSDGSTLSNAVNVVSAETTDSGSGYFDIDVTFSVPVDLAVVQTDADVQYPKGTAGSTVQTVRYYAASAQAVQVFGIKEFASS